MRLLLREALQSFRRAPLLSVLSITTIAFSLFTIGLFGLVAINMRQALREVGTRVEVVAYILRGTPLESITVAAQDISAFPEVLAVDYIDEEQALAQAQAELVEFRDAYRDLRVNPLPASFEIRLKEGFRDATDVAAVARRVAGFGFVEDVRFGREWIERLDQIRNVAGLVGLVIGIAFAAVAIVIIGTTIRMAVLQRAREIMVMRLVGATDWFIRGPFLLEGAIKGMLGGILSIGLAYGTFLAFSRNTTTLSGLVFFEPIQLLAGVLFGVAIGLSGSLVSVGRHLKDV
ncbi:MAG: permease-like cell division protein FtsX [Gemmatimonadales bacterium]